MFSILRRMFPIFALTISLEAFGVVAQTQTIAAYEWFEDVKTLTSAFISPTGKVEISTYDYKKLPSSVTFKALPPRGYMVSFWAWAAPTAGYDNSKSHLITGREKLAAGENPVNIEYRWAGWIRTSSTTLDWSLSDDRFNQCGAYPSVGVQFVPIPYNIAFDKGVSAAIGEMEIMKIPSFFLQTNLTANAFTRTGYSFDGWATNSTTKAKVFSDGQSVTGASFDSVVQSNDTVTLLACWTPNVYTVTFDPNGGSVSPTQKQVTYDAKYDDLPTPTWEGHAFNGWYTAKTGGSRVYDTTYVTRAEDHTFYAQWGTNSYQIRTETDGDGNGSVSGGGIYSYDESVTLKATPSGGSHFVQWDDGVTDNPRTVVVKGAATYTAVFALDGLSVRFNFKTATGGATNVVRKVPYGGRAEPPPDNVVDAWIGHTFDSWSPSEYSYVTRDHTETATYSENRYVIHFDPNGGTSNLDDISLYYSEEVTLPTAGRTRIFRIGYEFLGWSWLKTAEKADIGDGAKVNRLSAVDGATVVLYAVWSPISYSIAFEGGAGSTGSMDPIEGVPYDVVTNLTPNAFQKTGCSFLHWQLGERTFADGAAVSNLTTTANETVTLTAVWDAPYWVRFEPNGGEGEMAVQRFESAESKALASNAFTRTGYTFAGWKTNGVSSVVYLDGAVLPSGTFEIGTTNALTAVWSNNSYSVVYDPGCSDATGGMKDQKFVYDQEQTLTQNSYARDPELWSFAGWSNTLSRVTYKDKQTVSNLTAEANGKVTLVAQWKSNLSELSQALDCYNLNWTNEYEVSSPVLWTVTSDAGPYGGTCVVQSVEGGDSRVVLSATIHTNGTLTFYWKPTAAAAKLTVQLYSMGAKVVSTLVDKASGTVNTWNQMSVEITHLDEHKNSAAIQFMHENSTGENGFLYIDHVTWTPAGGSGYPVPEAKDARNVSALSMTAEGLSLSFDGDENFAYHLLATDSLSPMNWYDFGETNVGTGAKQALVVPVKDIETVPQRFFKIETLQRTK